MGAHEDGRDLAMIDLWRDLPKSLRNAGAGRTSTGLSPAGAVRVFGRQMRIIACDCPQLSAMAANGSQQTMFAPVVRS